MKFGDDQAGNHVALFADFTLIASFPLLLALMAILGLVLTGNPVLQISIQNSAFTEFPTIGTRINSQIGFSLFGHSVPVFAVGILGATLGCRVLAKDRKIPTRMRGDIQVGILAYVNATAMPFPQLHHCVSIQSYKFGFTIGKKAIPTRILA